MNFDKRIGQISLKKRLQITFFFKKENFFLFISYYISQTLTF